MCLTLWEWVFKEADQGVRQRVGCLAIEVVKLLVKLLMKLYQTGPKILKYAIRICNFCIWNSNEDKLYMKIERFDENYKFILDFLLEIIYKLK
jgi:hypothetical protein